MVQVGLMLLMRQLVLFDFALARREEQREVAEFPDPMVVPDPGTAGADCVLTGKCAVSRRGDWRTASRLPVAEQRLAMF